MNNSDYWRERAMEAQKAQYRRIDKVSQELADSWEKASRELEDKIAAWYSRFASEQGMSLAEAHKTLDTRSMKAFKMSLLDYWAKSWLDDTERWKKELEAASARARLSRLEALQLAMRNKLWEVYGETKDSLGTVLRETYTDETYHNEYMRQQMEGKFSAMAQIPSEQVDEVLKKPWATDGSNWSDRIWASREKLSAQLQGELVRCLVTGESPVKAGRRIAERMGVGQRQAARLVNTECTYAQTLADKNTANEMGVKKMQYLATLESHTCDTCGSLDKKLIPVNDILPGLNAPPIHPNCRCTLVPYFPDNTNRWMRDPETEQGRMIRDTTFEEWKKKYLKK